MKKVFLTIALTLTIGSAWAQESFKRDGSTFTEVKSSKPRDVRANAEQTRFEWTDTKGRTYPIWIARTGSCFVIRTSQKGNEYRDYLGPELSAEVCRELGREYKPTKKAKK